MADTISQSFWHTYKSALYPLSFSEDGHYGLSCVYHRRTVKSLVDLASLAVVPNQDIINSLIIVSNLSSIKNKNVCDSSKVTPSPANALDSSKVTPSSANVLDSSKVIPSPANVLGSSKVTPSSVNACDSSKVTLSANALDSSTVTPSSANALYSSTVTPFANVCDSSTVTLPSANACDSFTETPSSANACDSSTVKVSCTPVIAIEEKNDIKYASSREDSLLVSDTREVICERKASGLMPLELCYPLMKAALHLFRDEAVEQILSVWPSRSLVLSDFVEPMFQDVNPLYSDTDLCAEMRRGIKYTTCLAHSFMICLKRKDPIKLRFLDLTGFPMAEITLSYLASHVLLVSNEERQKRIINRYNQVTRNLSELGLDALLRAAGPSSFPDDQPVVICLDALLHSEEPHLELCRALHASNGAQPGATSPLSLRIRRLDTNSLGVVRIIVLLELIQPQYLTAVSLQSNVFVNSELIVLRPAMKCFVNVTSLDLSSNAVYLTAPSSETAQSLATMLSNLVSLERLDLSSSRLTGCLDTLLSGIIKPLVMLRLNACDLDAADIAYLSISRHASTISELDLGVNCLSASVDNLATLLRLSARSITTLELAATHLDLNIVVDILSGTDASLRSLRYLDIRNTPAPVVNDIIRVVPFFIAMTHFDAVQLPYPRDIANEDYDEVMLVEVRDAFTVLINRLVRHLHDIGDPRPPVKLLFDKSA